MPAQVTHVAVAEKVYPSLLSKYDEAAFMVGTVFPDIRYLRVISREQTHTMDIFLQDVLEESNSFLAGLKFHSLVDRVHEQFMDQWGAYELCPPSPLVTQTFKTFAGEIHFPYLTRWNFTIEALNTIYPEEVAFNIAESDLRHWHSMLQNYFAQPPSDDSNKQVMLELDFGLAAIEKMNADIGVIRADKRLSAIARQFYEQFEQLILT